MGKIIQFRDRGETNNLEPQILELKDNAGRIFGVMERTLNIAIRYGWSSGIADETLARALDQAREDGEGGWTLHRYAEVDSLIKFCRGGPAYNAAMPTEYGGPQGCNDPAELNVAFRTLVEAISQKLDDLRNLINELNTVAGRMIKLTRPGQASRTEETDRDARTVL
jgi:hypothetical protein